MRGRFLTAFVLALASVTVWAAAIPFASSAPVAVAYSVASGHGTAGFSSSTTQQSFSRAAARDGGLADYSVLGFDWRTFLQPDPTDTPIDATATPVPLDPTDQATVKPNDQPTDQPDRTDTPDPVTPTPTETPRPEPTATPHPTRTPEPTNAPTPTRTPEPTRTPSPSPTRTPEPTPRPTASPSPTPRPTASPSPTPRPTEQPTPSPTPKPTLAPTPEPTPKPTTAPTTYSGQSHFWYPALNIDASWGWYGCDYGGPNTMPAGIWRWGCGPSSNIYLLSHAYSAFKKIKLAYHSGALQTGQTVWYANPQGVVSKWEVKWIRRVTGEYLNATAGDWALNDSPTPIMTLQTCDGAQSQLRIIVRLVPAN
ncbi:MAG: hypothetical protein ABI744_02490 [Chloroflexota bacterium]